MIKKISLMMVLLICTCRASYCEEDQDVPFLVRDYVETMNLVKPSLLDLFGLVECYDAWDIFDGREETLRPENIPALITALENLNSNLEAAALKVEPYTSSSQESIKTAATQIKNSYQHFKQNNENSIVRLKTYRENATSSPKEEDLQKIGYDIEGDVGLFTSSLYHSSGWVIEAIGKAYPEEIGRVYPPQERKDILNRLKFVYGEDVETQAMSMLEGIHFSNAVFRLYEALKEEENIS